MCPVPICLLRSDVSCGDLLVAVRCVLWRSGSCGAMRPVPMCSLICVSSAIGGWRTNLAAISTNREAAPDGWKRPSSFLRLGRSLLPSSHLEADSADRSGTGCFAALLPDPPSSHRVCLSLTLLYLVKSLSCHSSLSPHSCHRHRCTPGRARIALSSVATCAPFLKGAEPPPHWTYNASAYSATIKKSLAPW